ncbi:MAG: phosphatidylinositol N-acetylglucosaminyltransferase subunit gpi1 [Cirrosporium novae-zelandiae]|nr:MAG: phosphatidylinositol N-acetylglucosaminyltransferase subunit gpi1 [Cirrosporium novae-zelandiae]
MITIPFQRLGAQEATLHPRVVPGISAREQLRRRDLPRSRSPGVIIGWKNSESDVFVLAILEDVELKSVENALRAGILYRNGPHPIARIFQLCGRPSMRVIGLKNAKSLSTNLSYSYLYAYTNPTSKFPSIWCEADSKVTVQIIIFDRPHPTRMQYMSLNPIALALGDKYVNIGKSATELDGLDSLDAAEEKERARKLKLANKLRMHTVIRHQSTQKELSLPLIITQVNCSFEMGKLLEKNAGLVGTRPKRSLSMGERVVESATTLWDYAVFGLWHVITVWVYQVVIVRLFTCGLICHRVIAEIVLRILEWRARPETAALKDISATAQQVDVRLQQFCYWPIQYFTLRRRKYDWESVTTSHPDYIRFYNSLWLVANDVIIGIGLGSYLIENAPWFASVMNAILTKYTTEGLQPMIAWLMGWPAGLKLNTELAVFLGDLFLWVIQYWTGCIANLQPHLPQLIYFIGFSSFAGASMPIALVSDLLSILTIHIYYFYVVSARIFNWQLTILLSLFYLFSGKKRNVLRNRIDSCDYDLDQLLLGTIFFTLLFFLLPTVLVFYLTFASARMIIISLKALLDTCLACLNHFPLFALMLRVKDSRRLPGGIKFELRDPPSDLPAPPPSSYAFSSLHAPPTSYIHLKSVPLPLHTMFSQYFQLAHRIRAHYLSTRVIFCLATGQFVPPIHRMNLYSLQYSMLPKQRAGIMEVWRRLTERERGRGGKVFIGKGWWDRRY